ncbi:MAG: FAD-dependent oxidoreductase [Cellulomonas sp.]|nr:FAD-dependent oxidoreductase [Cellulomonas sp.]
MSDVDFDVAVVGAGPAGAVTALLLARAGRTVVLLDRGERPGSKNLSGGVLYGRVLDTVLPGWLDEAPVERTIGRNVVTLLTPTASVGLDYRDARLGEDSGAVSVLRSRLDPWLVERCEEAGAMSMPGILVDRLLTEPGTGALPTVVGVRAGEDDLRCHVVVAADGVNSFLARGIGLREAPAPAQLAVGVKAVIGLPRATLEERFGVTGRHGVAHALVGDATDQIAGGAFCYTNLDSVSVGVVLRLDDLVARGADSAGVLDHLLAHPFIADLVRGGELLEYGAHLVNEGGLGMLGRVHTDGLVVVGDAAGLTLNTGLTIRGMDLAIGSAICAARAVDEALATGDTSALGLSAYRRLLDGSFVGRDLRTFAKAPAFLERPRTYTRYAGLAADVLHEEFAVSPTPRRPLRTVALDTVRRSPVALHELAADAWAGWRAL